MALLHSFIHNNAVAVGDIAVCGTRGWLYNAETEEDLKIVNREVGRLNASLDEAGSWGSGRWYSFIIRRFMTARSAENFDGSEAAANRHLLFWAYPWYSGCEAGGNGEYDGIKMVLVSCDYVKIHTGFGEMNKF